MASEALIDYGLTHSDGNFASAAELDGSGGGKLVVNDAALLFSGNYERVGDDLIISRPFEKEVIHNYFHGLDRQPLYAPDGSSLQGGVVTAITLHGASLQYAQNAPPAPAAQAIGRVEIARGEAQVMRNGQLVTLHHGDLVFRGEAVQTGAQAVLSITFLDGTAFTLEASARMVLNDMVYDPQNTNNTSLFTLVQGSIGFVAGDVAHKGEMKVDTPVSTIGIRGTAIHVIIESNHGRAHFAVMREPNGRVGRYVLYDHHDPTHVLATVSDVNTVFTLDEVNGVTSVSSDPKTPTFFTDENALNQLTFQAYQFGQQNPLRAQLGIGQPNAPNAPPPETNPNGNNPDQPETPQAPGTHDSGGGEGGGSPPLDTTPSPTPTPTDTPGPDSTSPFTLDTTPFLSPTLTTVSFSSTPTTNAPVELPIVSDPISVLSAYSGGIVGPAGSAVSFSLLAGATDNIPGATLGLAVNSADQPIVSVSVTSGVLSSTSIAYTVSPTGVLEINPAQFDGEVAPGQTVTLAFSYTLVDSTGAQAPQTAYLTIDGGSAVAYPGSSAPIVVGSGPVTITPTVVSPEGGDNFALDPPGVLLITQAGLYGSAVINTATGQLTYTPSAAPGSGGLDPFTITDTDSAGVATSTTLQFSVDGGTSATYATVTTSTAVVADQPTLIAPVGGDQFAFVTATGTSLTETGLYGTAAISATTGVITYTPGSTPGTDAFNVQDTDGDGVTTTASASFVVEAPSAPTLTVPPSATLTVGAATPISGVSIAEGGALTGETFTVTLTDANGVLSASGAGVSGSGTTSLTITGTLSQVNADLSTLTDTAPASDTITVTGSDSLGDVAATQSIAVAVNGIMPALTVPPSETLTVGAAQAISGVSLAEPGALASETYTVNVVDNYGLLSATGVGVSGSGTTDIIVTGSLAEVNADLATLSVVENGLTPDSILVSADDSLGEYAAGQSIALTVNGFTPALTVPPSETLTVGAAQAISGVSLAEPGALASETYTVNLVDNYGLLSATGAGVSGSGTTDITVTGSLTQVNADLATLSVVENGLTPDSILVSADDSLGEYAAGQSIALTVNGFTPALTVPPSETLTVGAAQAISGVSLAEPGALADETFTVDVSDGSGVLSATGVGVSGSGTTALTFTGSLAEVNAGLATLGVVENGLTSDTIYVSGFDSLGENAAPQSIGLTVNGFTPALTVPPSQTLTVGAAQAIAGVSLAEPGALASETFTVDVSDGSGVLSATGVGVSGSGTTALTFTGSLAEVNAGLATLGVVENGLTSDTIYVSGFDSLGENAAPQSVGLTVNGFTPALTVPPSQTLTVGAAQAISGVSLAEPGALASETYTVNLVDNYGLLSATGAGVSGSGTTDIIVTGSLAEVNADLATLSVVENGLTPDSILVSADDSLGEYAAGQSIALTVNGEPGTPVVAFQTPVQTVEGFVTNVRGVSISEAGATDGEIFTVHVSDTSGFLFVDNSIVNYVTALTVSGTLAEVNATLSTLEVAQVTSGPDVIQIVADDQFGGTSGIAAIAVNTPALSPAISGHAPVDAAVGVAATISGLNLSEVGSYGDEYFTVVIQDQTGELSAPGFNGDGTHQISLDAPLPTLVSDLAALTYTTTAVGDDTISVTLADPYGNTSTSQIAVNTTDLATVIKVGVDPVFVNEGSQTSVPGLSISEPNAPADSTYTVTLSDIYGVLSVATGDAGVMNNGSVDLTLTGSLAEINATLATLTDQQLSPDRDLLTITVDSAGTTEQTQTVAVTPSDLYPYVSTPGSVSTPVGVATAVPYLAVYESGAYTGENFTVVLTDAYGTLTATGGSGTAVVTEAGTKLTITGSLSSVDEALATVKVLESQPQADTIAVTVDDSLGNIYVGTPVPVAVTGPLQIVAAPSMVAVPGYQSNVPGLGLREDGFTSSETFKVSISSASGDVSETSSGIAGLEISGSGSNTLTISGTYYAVEAALGSIAVLDANPGTDTLTIVADDSVHDVAATQHIAVTVEGGAQVYTWAGETTDLADPANWNISGSPAVTPPTYLDTADIDSTTSISGGLTAAQLNINGSVTIGADVTTTIGGGVVIGAAPETSGQVNVSSHWLDTGFLTLGGGSSGQLDVASNGVVDVEGGLQVGDFGGAAGTVDIEQGELLTADFVSIGASTNVNGTAIVNGVGAEWVSTGLTFTVGDQGPGSLTISDDATVSAYGFTVGAMFNTSGVATGDVLIESGATLTTFDYAAVGDGTGADGSVEVETLGVWNAGSLTVGYDGGTGTVTVNDGRVVADGVTIGTSYDESGVLSNGTLFVDDNAAVYDAGGGDVGVAQGATGTLTVTGQGSSWTSSSYLFIGDVGTGTLYVEDDATLSAANLYIGVNYNEPTIAAGSGTAFIESGGVVTTYGEYQEIGNDATGTTGDAIHGATGALTVTGAGSEWDAVNGNISIGDAGSTSGILIVSDGGKVVSTGAIWIGDEYNGKDGSYGTLTIESGGVVTTGGTAATGGTWSVIGANYSGIPTSTATVTGTGSTWSVDELIVNQSGVLQVLQGGSVDMETAFYLEGGTLKVDTASTFEDGDAGGAALGYLTIDADPNFDSNFVGTGTVEADVIDNGKIYTDDQNIHATMIIEGPTGVADTGTLTGTGGLYAGTGTPLDLATASVASSLIVGFAGWDATVEIESTGFSASIYNFEAGDTLDVQGLAYNDAASSYTFTPSGSTGGGTLVIQEGASSTTLVISYAPTSLSGALTLSSYADGTGTSITFTDGATQSPFNLWSAPGSLFNTAGGTVNGEDYALSNVTDGGTPVWLETETPASGYVQGAPGNYTIVLSTQDWLGDVQPEITVATDSNFVDPFANGSSVGNLAGATIFSNTSSQGNGGIVYWAGTTGDYSVNLETFTVSYPGSQPSANLVTLGSSVTMLTGIADPLGWNFNAGSGSALVLGYMTENTSATENLYFDSFTLSGAAMLDAPVEVASDLPDATPYFVGFSGGTYYYRYLAVDSSVGAGLIGGTFNPTTGAVGSLGVLLDLPTYTSFTGVASTVLSTGNSLRFVEGVDSGQAVLQAFLNNSSSTPATAVTTFDLTSSSDNFQIAHVYDANTNALDYTVVAYTDNNQVHLELLNELGQQIGADYIVPGITSFLRIDQLQGNTPQSTTRVEIDYQVANPNGGEEIESLIIDTAAAPTQVTLSGGGLWNGSPFDDTFTWGAGVFTIGGGGGVDTFVATNLATTDSSLTIKINATGETIVNDGVGDVDTLVGFSVINLADATIAINGNVLTQTNQDHSKVISTFNITGETYAETVATYNAAGSLSSKIYYNADGTVYFTGPAIVEITAQTPVLTNQGYVASVAGVQISEAGAIEGETFTVSLSDATGVLSAQGAGVSGSGESLTITGSLSAVNAALATLAVQESGADDDVLTINVADSLGSAISTAPVELRNTAAPFQFNNSDGGDWNQSLNWNTQSVPTSVADAAISLAVLVTIAGADDSVNTLTSVAGSALQIDSGSLTVAYLSDLQGSVTIGGGEQNGTLDLAGSVTFEAIDINAGGQLLIEGDQTLNSGTLNLGGGTLWNSDPLATGATLTLGSGLTVEVTATSGIYSTNATTATNDLVVSYAEIDIGTFTLYIQPDAFTNYGTIIADNLYASLYVIPTTHFLNYGTVAVSDDATATVGDGVGYIGQPGDVTNEFGGVISATAGASITFGNDDFVNNGELQINASEVTIAGPLSGTGEIFLANGASLLLDNSVESGQIIELQDTTDTLQIADPTAFEGEIVLAGAGSAINLTTVPAASIEYAYIQSSQLVIQETGGTVLTLNLSGDLVGEGFSITADDVSGSVLTLGPATQAFWGGTGGDWSSSSNWANETLPTSAIAAEFDTGGADIVTVTTDVSAQSLTVNALGVDIEIDAGGLSVGALTLNGGTLDMAGGYFYATSSITIGALGRFIGLGSVSSWVNNGYVEAEGNFTFTDAVTGTGNYQIDAGVTLEFDGAVAGGTVTFGTSAGQLTLGDPNDFHAEIAGIAGSDDVIFLKGITDVTSVTSVYSDGITTLTVDYGPGDPQVTLTLVGNFPTADWTYTLASDNSGTYLADPPPSTASAPVNSTPVGTVSDSFVFKPVSHDEAVALAHTDGFEHLDATDNHPAPAPHIFEADLSFDGFNWSMDDHHSRHHHSDLAHL